MNRVPAAAKHLLYGTFALMSVLLMSTADAAKGTGHATATVINPVTVVVSTAGQPSNTDPATLELAGDTGISYAITDLGNGAVILDFE